MVGNKKNIDSQGDNTINNTGEGARFEINHYAGQKKILNRTYLFDFCLKFSEVDDVPDGYDADFTSDFEGKMDYNEIDVYKEIFFECDHYLDDVESILEEIPRRQRILSNINTKYKKLKRFGKWDNKDELCEGVYNYLIETIQNDDNSKDIYLEDAELAIHALMYYAFTKCKLLDPIPKVVVR
ncbi:hypothetical protein [Radiobacillus deserti]|uniref:Uncharacterized protein n=1 Tax=Radiobacillus deserti TaxID=2594883 RepID=A0A516KDK5_9BACI|nr:hypothetical protein [Radiobacillus deserti]QDP39447.1 hypothetical protein FN924_04200 [Radiobacillus deserti]